MIKHKLVITFDDKKLHDELIEMLDDMLTNIAKDEKTTPVLNNFNFINKKFKQYTHFHIGECKDKIEDEK